jgi:hypothetical protein
MSFLQKLMAGITGGQHVEVDRDDIAMAAMIAQAIGDPSGAAYRMFGRLAGEGQRDLLNQLLPELQKRQVAPGGLSHVFSSPVTRKKMPFRGRKSYSKSYYRGRRNFGFRKNPGRFYRKKQWRKRPSGKQSNTLFTIMKALKYGRGKK